MGEAAIESAPSVRCDECGAPADVHISNMVAGEPTMQHLCGRCVDALAGRFVSRRRHFSEAAVLIAIGAFVFLLSLFADYLRFGVNRGFGVLQLEGVLLGAILLLLGAVAKARTLLTIGGVIAVISLLADWLAFGQAEGFGIQQKMGCAIGALVAIAGFWISRRRR